MQGEQSAAMDSTTTAAAAAGSKRWSVASPPTSPLPNLRQRSNTGDRMRIKRSSSRVDGVSRHGDEDGAKTAVKVAVRVRPPLRPTDPGFDLIPQRFRESTCEVPNPTSLVVQSQHGSQQAKKHFIFDRVFDENASQQDVWGYVSDSVNSFVQGYNVSILAYGQSGAGKSYTMGTSGPDEQNDSEIMGIVPRAAQALFEKLEQGASRPTSLAATGLRTPKRYSTQGLPTLNSLAQANRGEKNWTLKATYAEIYNEQLRDLLVPESVPHADRAKVEIREDKGKIILTGLTQVEITSVEDMLGALNFGSSIRQTDATAINARSSRSHAVFSLNLVQKKPDQTSRPNKRMSVPLERLSSDSESFVNTDSKLHFVDLAGSERLKNTQATGERAKEGISINGGLASLGKVISQLSSKKANSHISYRDSRLTRLLQDSLGGNAITFMVACVTPAAFHLTETNNTLHYALRARDIQVRPELQQSHEDGDKQATIERLRAEISFLRGQMKHSENGVVRSNSVAVQDNRAGRIAKELQTEVMDIQESYNALSQRHAKLISEISKARDDDADTPMLNEAIGESATERLRRSNSFAEAVEQVVLEYEKTIQSLESSLSKTRHSLQDRESMIQDKETRIAYMETVQQQLNTRLQKITIRESTNESYVRDLESRMEGSATGEEKMTEMISELRKELSRARENGTNAEEYITTLEERLAEAEQDQDIMQHEIDRLEQVVERQRSIGRLDNLLTELDNGKTNGQVNGTSKAMGPPPKPNMEMTNGHRESYDPFRPESPSVTSAAEDDEFADVRAHQSSRMNGEDDEVTALPTVDSFPARSSSRTMNNHSHHVRTPTQDDIMADKLENLTQELFDLRSEHEGVITDYDNLQQKYQTALETLAKLEYDKETPRQPLTPTASRPESFLADAGMRGEERAIANSKQLSSSRSLGQELSSLPGESNSTEDLLRATRKSSEDSSSRLGMHDEIAVQDDVEFDPAAVPLPDDELFERQELETLRKLHAEKEVSMHEIQQKYRSLADEHKAALQHVEDLRVEVQRSHYNIRPVSPALGRPTSPALSSPGFGKSMNRRRSDELMGSDRASRGFASLKNIALDNFEKSPDTMQSFELNLNAVMTELHGRSERVHNLEAELLSVRREMEGKQALITGLTRERTSLKANSGGVDFSVMGQMRDQLLESERQIRTLHEQHSARESEFQVQIASLRSSLAEHQRGAGRQLPTPSDDHMPGDCPESPMGELDEMVAGSMPERKEVQRSNDVAHLQSELDAWETKHESAMESMKSSEAKLLNTIADLEASMRNVQGSSSSSARGLGIMTESTPVSEDERAEHKKVVDTLQREVDDYKSTANNHVAKLEQLEQAYAKILTQVDEDSQSHDLTQKELKTHKDLVANLENQLRVHKSAITIHQESLESLQGSHTKEIEELKRSMEGAEKQSKERNAALENHHSSVRDNLQSELKKVQGEHAALLAAAAAALGAQTNSNKLRSQIEGLVDEGKDLHTRHTKATNDLKSMQEELQGSLTKSAEMETQVGQLKMGLEEAQANLTKMTEKEAKSSRLVEELEEQLNSNFDSHRAVNHRLSRMETASVQARMEMERELEELRLRNGMLEQQLGSAQRQSINSDRGSVNFNRESLSPEAAAIALARSPSQQSAIRKSGAPTALPTPPPSIPLPPLPGITAVPQLDRASSPVQSQSPPSSRHGSKEIGGAGMSQMLEEQESRIRTIEKHLFAEKQLTATLEEALVDLETSANSTKQDMEAWKRKCGALEDELVGLRKEKSNSRASLQAVEEEREMRVRAERARQALEQRMMELNSQKKKKGKGALNCF